jgi:hypothetical protein
MSDAVPSSKLAGADALHDLPRELWLDLLRTFRRAIEPLEDAELPAALRPFRGWKPDRLVADRPRRLVAAALAGDARLREQLARAIANEDRRARLQALPLPTLVSELGEERAATVLVAAARWGEVAALATDVSQRHVRRARAAAERRAEPPAGGPDEPARHLEAELAAAARARDTEARARAQADLRAGALEEERDALVRQVAELRARTSELEAVLREERIRNRDRLERARRRAAEATSRRQLDEARIRDLAGDLEHATAALLAAVEAEAGGPASRSTGARDGAPAATNGRQDRLPRAAPPAKPGRPCGLPPGLTREQPEGVQALLATPGILAVIDGYNVSKARPGIGAADLMDQRQWLVRLAAGVVARYRLRAVVVFDSTLDEDAPPPPGARGVVVDFASSDETADDRIVALVEGADEAQPVLVVTSDRELGRRCAALHVDVVPAEAFLATAT